MRIYTQHCAFLPANRRSAAEVRLARLRDGCGRRRFNVEPCARCNRGLRVTVSPPSLDALPLCLASRSLIPIIFLLYNVLCCWKLPPTLCRFHLYQQTQIEIISPNGLLDLTCPFLSPDLMQNKLRNVLFRHSLGILNEFRCFGPQCSHRNVQCSLVGYIDGRLVVPRLVLRPSTG